MSYMNILFLINFIGIFSIPICRNYQNYCSKCNPLTNICVECEYDNFIPDKNGGCIPEKCKVGINYCNECNLDGKTCLKCEKGYFPDSNGGCSYTDNCLLSSNGLCLECLSDYILIGNYSDIKFCKYIKSDDLKNCKEVDINNGLCLLCDNGYYLNWGDSKCTKIKNCYESIYGNCIACDSRFYLNKKNNSCVLKDNINFTYCKESYDDINCEVCEKHSYFAQDKICIPSNFCLKSNDGKCEKCRENYYLAQNFVCSNEPNCFFADKDTGLCNICNNDYFLDNKDYKCKSNQEENNYKYCKKVINNQCSECIERYRLSEDLKCTSTYNCIEAENGNCILCAENYTLGLDHKCSLTEHCAYSNEIGYCLECDDGYYYNRFYNNCTESGEKLKNCKYAHLSLCSECKTNYYLNRKEGICIDNTQKNNFYKCALSNINNEYCERCEEGYYLGSEDRKCSLIPSCKISLDENTCIECDEYYVLDLKKGTCIPNDFIEDEKLKFYINCNKTNEDGTACVECKYGYEVSEEGYCVDVMRCIEKENDKCMRCTDDINENGFTYCANNVFGCIESAFEGCLRCDNLLNLFECTECKEGYFKLSHFPDCQKIIE